ncbi:hypothetical protein DS408_09145 [Escherichia coli]|nr:hypothetical protein [Escherichia coli]EFN9538097.1 hypothetical protein [Escherichia coli]EFO0457970.1 hypothetical protein [Escherichia coli]EFO0677098.1 hypothetical protein [Escherichia coli]EFO2162070.1 hypothetical protein [Escherichia coli]
MKRKPNRCNSFLTLTLTLNIQGKRSSCNILVKLITEFTNNKKSSLYNISILFYLYSCVAYESLFITVNISPFLVIYLTF